MLICSLPFGGTGVSLTLFCVSRISPGEWDNPFPCNQDENIVENQFSIGLYEQCDYTLFLTSEKKI